MHLARLLEETKGKASRNAEADMKVSPASCRRATVRSDRSRLGADLEKEAALVSGLPGSEVLDFNRVGWNARLVVEHLDFDEVRPPDLSPKWQGGAGRPTPHTEA